MISSLLVHSSVLLLIVVLVSCGPRCINSEKSLSSSSLFTSSHNNNRKFWSSNNHMNRPAFIGEIINNNIRGGSSETSSSSSNDNKSDNDDKKSKKQKKKYGRISDDEYILTPEQIESFHNHGCITIEDVLTNDECDTLCVVFDKFVSGEIYVPGRDFCDMSKPYNVPYEQWSLVNCMLPTKYYPPLQQNNVYEKLTSSIAKQLYPISNMVKDYDQLLNKRPGKQDAIFAWHQDMAYWPSSKVLNVNTTNTCTFSLALDDSDIENGCLRYVVGSNVNKVLREHKPLTGDEDSGRDEGHAITTYVHDHNETIQYAPAKRGSITIHDEWVIHGSGGNNSTNRQRRTYVVAYRAKTIVDAERSIGFTHSHNDQINWDTFEQFQNNNNNQNKNNNDKNDNE